MLCSSLSRRALCATYKRPRSGSLIYSNLLLLFRRLHRLSRKSIRSRRPMSRTDGCVFSISYAKDATGTSVVKSRRCIRSAIVNTSSSRFADMYAGRAGSGACSAAFFPDAAPLEDATSASLPFSDAATCAATAVFAFAFAGPTASFGFRLGGDVVRFVGGVRAGLRLLEVWRLGFDDARRCTDPLRTRGLDGSAAAVAFPPAVTLLRVMLPPNRPHVRRNISSGLILSDTNTNLPSFSLLSGCGCGCVCVSVGACRCVCWIRAWKVFAFTTGSAKLERLHTSL